VRTNPYDVSVDEFDLRHPDADFLAYQLVPVLALLALTGGALVTALALAGEREEGIVSLVQTSPARPGAVVAGHLAGGALGAATLLAAVVVPAAWLGALRPPPGRWRRQTPASALRRGLVRLCGRRLGRLGCGGLGCGGVGRVGGHGLLDPASVLGGQVGPRGLGLGLGLEPPDVVALLVVGVLAE